MTTRAQADKMSRDRPPAPIFVETFTLTEWIFEHFDDAMTHGYWPGQSLKIPWNCWKPLL